MFFYLKIWPKSRKYHHLENHPQLSNLIPIGNLTGGTRRIKNLSEILSPSEQQTDGGVGSDGPGGDGDDGTGGGH